MTIGLWVIAIGIVSTFMYGVVSLAIILYRRPARVSPIFSPHGWNLRRFAEFCFSKKTFAQILEPALSDMEKEYFEALAANRPWKARMVLVRGYWSFWSAFVAQLPIPFVRLVCKIWTTTNTGS